MKIIEILSEGLLNHFINKGDLINYRKEKKRFDNKKRKLLNNGFQRVRDFRDDLQNRCYEYIKIM